RLEPVHGPVLSQLDLVSLQLGIDGLVFFPGGEQAEPNPPAKLGRAFARRHRHLDVVGVDGVLAREVPDLEAQRVAADAGLDRPFDADLAPGPAHQGLPCLPLLKHLQRAHRSPNPHAAGIPSVEPAAEGQLIHGSVEAGLVVDLVGGQMGDDVLDAPAATVAGRRPLPRAKGAKVRPQPRDLAVVDGKGINASWVEGSCAWRWRVSPSVQASVPEGLRSRPAPPMRRSSPLTSSRWPVRHLRRIAPGALRRRAESGSLYAAASLPPSSQASLP